MPAVLESSSYTNEDGFLCQAKSCSDSPASDFVFASGNIRYFPNPPPSLPSICHCS